MFGDKIDDMLAQEVLSSPSFRDGLSDREREIIDAWLKRYNDSREAADAR